MTFSCSDFADEVLAEFIRLRLVDGSECEDDNASQHAGLCMGALSGLVAAADSLRHQVEQMRGMFDDADGTIAAACADYDNLFKKAQASLTGSDDRADTEEGGDDQTAPT